MNSLIATTFQGGRGSKPQLGRHMQCVYTTHIMRYTADR